MSRVMLRRRLAWRGGPSQVVMVVLSVAMLATACGSGSTGGGSKPTAAQPPTSTTRLLEVAPAPDPTTADGVAVTALEQIYTWYPATESEGDALRRARKWLGPSLIRVLDTPTGSVETPRPVLRWTEWAKAGAHVEAFAFASGEKAPRAPTRTGSNSRSASSRRSSTRTASGSHCPRPRSSPPSSADPPVVGCWTNSVDR